jgi:predicted transposase YdaD
LLGFFASFVLDTELVSQIMRWDMTVLRESPWYQEILQEGEQRGEKSLILRQLTRRIGSITPDLETQIRNLSIEQLESLGEALLEFSEPTDLVSWLQQHRSI